MFKKFPFLVKIASLTTVLIVSFGLSYAYAAWTAPTAPPPGANIAVPLNTGPVAQHKTGTLEFSNNIGTRGFSPTSGLPTGWGGGVHTWDVYAEGTVGVGKGGSLKAYLSDAGDIYASGNITAGGSINVKSICLNGVCRTSWPTATVAAPIKLPLGKSYSFKGKQQTYTVPAGVTRVRIDAYGAQGNPNDIYNNYSTLAGLGGYSTGPLLVTPNEVLYIHVGGENGYNGGGGGGYGDNHKYGSNGGGASDVRVGGTNLNNRVIVAGGGGGWGHKGNSNTYIFGGAGGGSSAVKGGGGLDAYRSNASGGIGGTPYNGGAGGNTAQYGQNPWSTSGNFGSGGRGGWGNYNSGGGGGGGGGYWGGGGGGGGADGSTGAGGGGGSSYIGGLGGGIMNRGGHTGNGYITITPF